MVPVQGSGAESKILSRQECYCIMVLSYSLSYALCLEFIHSGASVYDDCLDAL